MKIDKTVEFLNAYPHLQNTKNKKKPILFLIHGFATDHRCFRYLEQNIKSFNYYSFDLPGSIIGMKYPSSVLKVSGMAKLIIKYIEANNLSNIILIGHSMGGAIAGIIASLIPIKINSLIMLSPLNKTSMPKLIDKFDKFNVKDHKSFMKLQREIFVNPTETLEEIDKEEYYKQTLLLFKNNFKYLLKTMIAIIDISEIFYLDSKFRKIKIPTMILLGEKDNFIRVKHCKSYFEKIINGVDIKIIKSSGHGFFVEKKIDFFNIINDYIKLREHE
ncbi:MAG: alpha/beta hydrolase [Malacoplasma sp.]